MKDQILNSLLENPESVEVIIKEVVNQYKPLAYSVLNELFDVYKDYANNVEYFNTAAKAKKNQFDAYINAGFNEDQAMIFMVSDYMILKEQIEKSMANVGKSKKNS